MLHMQVIRLWQQITGHFFLPLSQCRSYLACRKQTQQKTARRSEHPRRLIFEIDERYAAVTHVTQQATSLCRQWWLRFYQLIPAGCYQALIRVSADPPPSLREALGMKVRKKRCSLLNTFLMNESWPQRAVLQHGSFQSQLFSSSPSTEDLQIPKYEENAWVRDIRRGSGLREEANLKQKQQLAGSVPLSRAIRRFENGREHLERITDEEAHRHTWTNCWALGHCFVGTF
ncbi:hypothetical protein DNTS_010159 [Danionella cerebrum]|uniref:Uncharacterized protein n=1 Tax=Danionella cerebrum TaxID=2873325 RepID=A0A553RHD4_9TELE|nr:hypothetical protein DNTS_010159 [Danionella translucida]